MPTEIHDAGSEYGELMMTKEEFLGLLEEILEEDPGTLTGTEKLKEQLAGWNSLAVVSFIALVDERFEVALSPKAIAGCKTVNDLIGLLNGKVTD
jgi:acyl carrier protein